MARGTYRTDLDFGVLGEHSVSVDYIYNRPPPPGMETESDAAVVEIVFVYVDDLDLSIMSDMTAHSLQELSDEIEGREC